MKIDRRFHWLLCLMLSGAGCAQLTAINTKVKDGFRSARSSGGESMLDHEYDDSWVREAGIEARGDRPLEHENDSFRSLMSPKARSIERNLGLD